MKKMVSKKGWQEFRASGLLWWINRILHTFGWAIVFEFSCKKGKEDKNNPTKIYPARCKYRGFDYKSEEQGFRKISKYLRKNIVQLEKETYE